MSESARPSQSKADETAAAQEEGRGAPKLERAARSSILELLSLSDGLRSDIEAIWNESPDYLAMLAEWSDLLAVQQTELAALLAGSGRAGEPVGNIGRVGREIAREMGAVFAPGGRLRRVLKAGSRLLLAQTKSSDLSGDPAQKTLLETHRLATERHLRRLAMRMPHLR